MFSEKTILENFKKVADEIELRVEIYGDQFGPNDDFVVKLKKELYEVNQKILHLMVMEQETWVKAHVIE